MTGGGAIRGRDRPPGESLPSESVARDPINEYFVALEAELTEERAAALGRAGRKVETALQRCNDLLEHLTDAPGDAALLDEYRGARTAFEQALWAYCVQRESLGLWDHSWVDRMCPTPPRR